MDPELELRGREVPAPRIHQGILDVIWAAAVVVNLRMEQVNLAAELSQRIQVRPPVDSNAPPVLSDDPRKDSLDHIVPGAQVWRGGGRQPEIRLAELLEPHLEVVQAVAGRE